MKMPRSQNKRLFSPGLIAESWHWIAGEPPQGLQQYVEGGSNSILSSAGEEFPYTAQIRHRQVPRKRLFILYAPSYRIIHFTQSL